MHLRHLITYVTTAYIQRRKQRLYTRKMHLHGLNGELNGIPASEMTCIVSGGALNSTHSLTQMGNEVLSYI